MMTTRMSPLREKQKGVRHLESARRLRTVHPHVRRQLLRRVGLATRDVGASARCGARPALAIGHPSEGHGIRAFILCEKREGGGGGRGYKR